MYIDFKGRSVDFRLVNSTFSRLFNEIEVKSLLDRYYEGKYLFNGLCFRLECVEESSDSVVLKVSKTDFYSLLVTNLLNYKLDILRSRGVTACIILSDKCFSNNLAISVLVVDSLGKIMLVKRTKGVAVGSEVYSTSVTGSFDYVDNVDAAVLFNLMSKEMMEELGISLGLGVLEVQGLYIGDDKLQPVLLCKVRLGVAFESLNLKGVDTLVEVDKFLVVLREDLKSCLDLELTQAARFHISLEIG